MRPVFAATFACLATRSDLILRSPSEARASRRMGDRFHDFTQQRANAPHPGRPGRRAALRSLFPSPKRGEWSAETALSEFNPRSRRGTHPCDRVRLRRSALHGGDFWPEVASVTGHGAGAGGSPRAPWDPGCEPGVLGRRWSAPLQDRLMKAPLIEQTASTDTFCLLFVNNF